MIQKLSLSKLGNQNNSHNIPKSINFHYWVIKIWTSFPLLSCQNIHLFVHPSNGFWYDSELPLQVISKPDSFPNLTVNLTPSEKALPIFEGNTGG